jgi:ABC-type multidrug transport system fused ATPase/permease subunit
MPGASKTPLKVTGRAILIIFGITWVLIAITGHILTQATWAEAALQALAFAGFAAIVAALMFPFAVIGLIWTLSVTLGLILSLGDLLAIFMASSETRKSWHRRVDTADHGLADLVLGQQAQIPLRADLAERAAEDAREAQHIK